MSVWHNGARVRVFPTRRWQNRSNQGEQMRKVVFQGAVCRVNVLVRHRRRADCGNTANQAAAGRASDKQESECGDVQSAGAGLSCSPAAARQRPWLPRVGSLPRMSIVVGAGRPHRAAYCETTHMASSCSDDLGRCAALYWHCSASLSHPAWLLELGSGGSRSSASREGKSARADQAETKSGGGRFSPAI
jgi:hypothetical protein